MLEMFKVYLLSFIHPYKIHHFLRDEIPLPEDPNGDLPALSINEAIMVSWVFVIIKGVIDMVLLLLMVIGLDYVMGSNPLAPLLKQMGILESASNIMGIMMIVLGVIVFPVVSLISVQVWRMIFSIYMRFIEFDGDSDQMVTNIITVSFSSNVVRAIPFVGTSLQGIVSAYLIYAGIRDHLSVGRATAFFMVIAPPLAFLLILMMGGTLLLFLYTLSIGA